MSEEDKQLWKNAGRRLAIARERAGYSTQKIFSEAVSLSLPTISKYEQGAREIPMKLLYWLSEEHGINAEWVITGRGNITVGQAAVAAPCGGAIVPDVMHRVGLAVEAVLKPEKAHLRNIDFAVEVSIAYNDLCGLVDDLKDAEAVEEALPLVQRRLKKRLSETASEPISRKYSA